MCSSDLCPVSPETKVAIASPARTMAGLITVAEASRDAIGGRTAVNLPALTVSIGEMLDALEQVAGSTARKRVRFEPDAVISRIVCGWPAVVESTRARRLGLLPDPDFISIVEQFLSDRKV